mgnify:CR=1 FL=1
MSDGQGAQAPGPVSKCPLSASPLAPRTARCAPQRAVCADREDYTPAVTATVPVPRTETPAGVLGLADVGRDDRSLRRFLHGLPPVDEAGLERRSAWLAGRRVAPSAERQVLDLAVSMVDLTTLEGADTPGRVRALCAQARRPDPVDPDVPSVAAVCVYPDLAAVAAKE